MRFALAATFVCATAASAQTPLQEPAPRLFEGRIVDVLGDGIPAARVEAIAAGRTVAKTISDGDGFYRLQLSTGADLVVTATDKVNARLPWRGTTTPSVRHVMLEDGARLGGRVVDATGTPAAGAVVVMVAGNGASTTTTADAQGRYTMPAVPLRPLRVHAATDSGAVTARVHVARDTELDLRLRESAGDIAVQVRELPVELVPRAHVRVFGSDFTAVANGGVVPLREDRSASIARGAPCMLSVRAPGQSFTPESQRATRHTTLVEFASLGSGRARATAAGRVRTVTGERPGALRFVVRDRSHYEVGTMRCMDDGALLVALHTPHEGFCRVGLPLGTWLLHGDETIVKDGCSWLPLDARLADLELNVAPAAVLRGRVQPQAGAAMPYAEIVVVDTLAPHLELTRTWADGAGNFAIGLPFGSYHLLAIGLDQQLARASQHPDLPIPYEVEWKLVPAGEVHGVVRDTNGPIAGVDLYLANAEIQGGVRIDASNRQTRRLVTDRAGRFRARGLPVGTWTLVAPDDDRVPGTSFDVADGAAVTLRVDCAK